jgi:hypothetical protein
MGRSSLLSEVFFTWRRPHYMSIILPWPPFSVLGNGATRKSSGIHRNKAIPKSQLSSQEHVRLMLFFGSRVRCFCMCSSFEHGFAFLGIALLGGQVLQALFEALRPKAFNYALVEALFCVRFREVQPPEYVHL